MRNPVSWHNASPADWELARQREAVVRPLAARPSLTPEIVNETARTLNLRRSLVYQLVARYRQRPQTSTLLLGQSGRRRGSRFLQPEREAVVEDAIQQYYLTRERPRIPERSRPLRQPINPLEFFFDFLPAERRLIRRDGIRLFNIHYWDNYLSPLAGRSQEPLVVKYDPRNLSRVYLRDEAGHYWPIPYRDLALPPISLWEHREAMKRLRQEGRRAVDERLIFSTILEQRKLVEVSRRTTRQRRVVERIRPLVASTTNLASAATQAEVSEITPFPVEEWS